MIRTPPATSGPSESAASTLRRAIGPILLATLVVAAGTYFVATRLPQTYKSTAFVRVTLPDNSSNRGTVGASNALAGRYAALIRSPDVVGRVAVQRQDKTRLLNVALTAGTVNGQNVIAVRATAPNAARAQSRADGAARALVFTARRASRAQTRDYQRVANAQLRLLNDHIRTIELRLARGRESGSGSGDGLAASDQQTLSVLQGQKAAIQVDNGTTAATDLPTVRVVSRALSATRIAPHPWTSALVALVVTPLLLVQLTLLLAAYRRPER